MKRCPTCNRTFIDDTQKFCLDDGSTLVEEAPSSFDPQATLAMGGAMPTAPPSNPYGSGTGQGSSGAGQGYSGSGAGQSGYGSGSGSGSGQGAYGSTPGQNQQAGSWTPTPQQFTPVGTAAPKRSILPWVLGGVAVVVIGAIGLIVILALVFSDSSNKNGNANNSNSKSGTSNSNSNSKKSTDIVIRSSDGKIQVSVPPSWKSTTELNDKAELQVSDVPNEMYMIVLTDNKADYTDMDLDRHSVATLDALTKAMTYSNRVGPTKMTINGNPAIQYEVRGEIKSVNVVYIHTTVETSQHYQQIVSWTLQSKYAEREATLKDAINSFKEN